MTINCTTAGTKAQCSTYGNDVAISNIDQSQLIVYQNAHYGFPYGSEVRDFAFHFTVPNARYQITLKFAAYSADTNTWTNQNIIANGVILLQNFSFFDVAGGSFIGYDRNFTIDVSNQTINLEFIHLGSEEPQVNGIGITFIENIWTPGLSTTSTSSTSMHATSVGTSTGAHCGTSTCPSNSYCSSGTCLCNSGYSAMADGTCALEEMSVANPLFVYTHFVVALIVFALSTL